jgi:hypothetical protein
MRVPIDDGDLAGNTECAAVVGYAREDADLKALFNQMLEPQKAAQILWPRESAAGWIETPVYRHYREPAGLSPEVFDAPLTEPAHITIGLYGIAKGTPSRDAMRCGPRS